MEKIRDDSQTVTIEHEQKGRVEGCIREEDNFVVRWKRTAFASDSYFYEVYGWREVSSTERVISEIEKLQAENQELRDKISDLENEISSWKLGN